MYGSREMSTENGHGATLKFSAVQAGYWMSFCICINYAAVFLQSLGYSNAQLGTILAVGNIGGVLLGIVLASLVDRNAHLHAGNVIPAQLAVQAAVLLPLLFLRSKSSIVSILYILYIAFSSPVNNMNLKVCVDLEYSGQNVNYAFSRGIGSFAYVLASMLLGEIVNATSTVVIPGTALIVTALQFLANRSVQRQLKKEGPKQDVIIRTASTPGLSLREFLRAHGRFCLVLLGTLLLFYSHNAYSNFMINVVRNVGGNTATMGYLNAFIAALEIPIMLLFNRIFRKVRRWKILVVSFLGFVLKAFAVAFADSISTLFLANLLQIVSFAIYSAAIVDYVNEVIPYEDSAKGQSLAFAMTTGGSVLSSFIAGSMYDNCTVFTTLLVAALVTIPGAALSILGLERKTSREDSGTDGGEKAYKTKIED
jgi:PPP family 3-phenylpropionic acid transporter